MERRIKYYHQPKNGIQYIVDAQIREDLQPFVFFDAGTHLRHDNGLSIPMHPHQVLVLLPIFPVPI